MTGQLAHDAGSGSAFGAVVARACAAPRHRDDSYTWEIDHEQFLLRVATLPSLAPLSRTDMLDAGASLVHLRAVVETSGLRVVDEDFPDPDDPSLVVMARLAPGWRRASGEAVVGDEHGVSDTDFDAGPLEERLLLDLTATTAGSIATALPLRDPSDQARVESLLSPAGAGRRWFRRTTTPDARGSLVLVTTPTDGPAAWLESGRTLGRLWLAARAHGLATALCPLDDALRASLRAEVLQGGAHVQAVLRVGRRPADPVA